MIAGISSSVMGASVQSMRMDVLASNLSDASCVGYKPRTVVLAEARGGDVDVAEVVTDFSQGQLRTTENPLNVALDGEGFFLASDGARRAYSRNGNLKVDAEGYLVSGSKGFRLLGKSGNAIRVVPGEPIVITAGGIVSQRGEERGQIGVVGIDSPSRSLSSIGGGMFVGADDGEMKELESGARVMQGTLEGSPSEPIACMVRIMDATRAYKTNMQMVGFQDSTLSKLINRVGSLPG